MPSTSPTPPAPHLTYGMLILYGCLAPEDVIPTTIDTTAADWYPLAGQHGLIGDGHVTVVEMDRTYIGVPLARFGDLPLSVIERCGDIPVLEDVAGPAHEIVDRWVALPRLQQARARWDAFYEAVRERFSMAPPLGQLIIALHVFQPEGAE